MRLTLPTILTVGLAVRLLPAWLTPEVADTTNYRIVAETLRGGGRLYADTPGIYPYPPVWFLVELAALWLAERSPIPFVFWVKLSPILADLGIVYLIHHLSSERGRGALVLAALYALNPVPLLIAAVHGQFDAISLLFCLAAIALLHSKSYTRAALAMAAAIAIKSFPILLLPLFLIPLPTWRGRIRFAALAVLPTGVLLAPFLAIDSSTVRRELLQYSGVLDHGLSVLLRLEGFSAPAEPARVVALSKLLFGLAYGLLVLLAYRRRKTADPRPLIGQAAGVFAAFYVAYFGISSQYLLWLLPFLILIDPIAAAIYSIVALAALLSFYSTFYPSLIYGSGAPLVSAAQAPSLWLASTLAWWLWTTVWLIRVRSAEAHARSERGPFAVQAFSLHGRDGS